MSTFKTRLSLFGTITGLVIGGVVILQWPESDTAANATNDVAIKDTGISNPSPVVKTDNVQASIPNELLQLKQQLHSKQVIIKRQRAELASMAIELSSYQPGTDDEMEDDFNDRDDDLVDYQEFSEANIVLLDETINNEQPDPEWSSVAIAEINDLLASDDFVDSELITTSCTSTLCRVETLQSNPDATELFIADFPLLISWSSNAFAQIINHENGDQSVVYFISREGYQLPRAES